MISVWVKQQWLTKNHLESVQQFIDKIHLPSDVGRIPLKIASGFAGFTADQWITIYSIPALFTILPTEQLECWRHFVLACRILCKQGLSRDDINLADCLLCNKVEILHGKKLSLPICIFMVKCYWNMVLHKNYGCFPLNTIMASWESSQLTIEQLKHS